MNKRAAKNDVVIRPLWYVGEGISTFVGPLNRNALHGHSVPVLLTAPYEKFKFRAEGAEWTSCQSALVPAGTQYEFDMDGAPLSVIYLEPTVARADALAGLVTGGAEAGGALTGKVYHTAILRDLYEDQESGSWAGQALRDIVAFGDRKARRHMDERVQLAARNIQLRASWNDSVDEVARSVGLSPSRFQHLFSDEVGTPYRRYRAWRRLLVAIREIASGANLTEAAHAAGYADQPHFTREFRRCFGAAPSVGIANVRG